MAYTLEIFDSIVMKIHKNAALTVRQRIEIKRLYESGNASIRELAHNYHVNPSTITKWVKRDTPYDKTPSAKNRRGGLTDEQKEAITIHRQKNPYHGPKTIAAMLIQEYGKMSHATIARFLKEKGLIRQPDEIQRYHLDVGKHRLQMDIQQLRSIEDSNEYEYKISVIHMSTRMKYSEIHPKATTKAVTEVLERAIGQLPPFFWSGPTTHWYLQCDMPSITSARQNLNEKQRS